ncbi:phage portal protein [Gordonia sp. NPDC003376]
MSVDLPANGTAWPPRPHNRVLAACAERQVWWEGDPDKLALFYGSEGSRTWGDATSQSRVKRAWRAFWGQREPGPSNPPRLHVPVAADLGRVAAQALFAEPVTITDPAGDEALQGVIDALINTDEAHSRRLAAAESASMLSGVYGRVVWDQEVSDTPWIDWVDADRAIPHFRWGHLVAVTFWSELDCDDDNVVLRWLQHYTPGRIDHGLYQGSRDNLGRAIPLTEHPTTAGIGVTLDGTGTGIATGTDRIAAGYAPNFRPAPEWRDEPALKDLGRADLTRDVIHLLDRIDRTWSSWMNDLDLGRGRMFASEELLSSRHGKAGFDLDQSVYSPVGTGVASTGEAITYLQAQQFAIRVDEHQRTFEGLLRRVLSRVGYSPLTFGLADEVAMTATEVDAKERDTNATRAARVRLWSPMLVSLNTTLLQVNSHLTGAPAPTEDLEVSFPAMRQQSDSAKAATVQMWEAARAASTETKVRYLHPEWDDKKVEIEVEAIDKSAEPPTSIFGPQESTFGPPAEADPNADPQAQGGEQPTDQPAADTLD